MKDQIQIENKVRDKKSLFLAMSDSLQQPWGRRTLSQQFNSQPCRCLSR